MDERPRVLPGATDAGIILAGLCWLQSGGLGDRLLVLRTVDKKTAARKPPLPIGQEIAAPNRARKSPLPIPRKPPLPFGDKKVAAPAGEAQLEGDDSVSSNEYRYRLVFRNEKPRRR